MPLIPYSPGPNPRFSAPPALLQFISDYLEIAGVTELHELSRDTFTQVTQAIADISKSLQSMTGASKMNIAALGNQVLMLHIHIIARNSDDDAWPGPVWGHGDPVPYSDDARQTLLAALQETLLSD